MVGHKHRCSGQWGALAFFRLLLFHQLYSWYVIRYACAANTDCVHSYDRSWSEIRNNLTQLGIHTLDQCVNVSEAQALKLAQDQKSTADLQRLYYIQELYQPIAAPLWPNLNFTTNPNVSSLQFRFAVSNFLYPLCSKNQNYSSNVTQPIGACASDCLRLQALILVLKNLKLVTLSPELLRAPDSAALDSQLLLESVHELQCNGAQVKHELCATAEVDLSKFAGGLAVKRILVNLDIFTADEANTSLQLSLSPLPCPYPFIATNVTSHYVPKARQAVRNTLATVFHIQRSVLSDDNIDKLFPCGSMCKSPGYSDADHRIMRTATAVMSSLVLVISLISWVVYFFILPKEAKKPTHRRLALAVSVALAMMAMGAFPANFDSSRSFYCFPDGSRRFGEPRASFACTFFGSLVYSGPLAVSFLMACLSYEWLVVVKMLNGITVASSGDNSERRRFFIYIIISAVPTVVLIAILLGMHRIIGTPLTGTCGVSHDKLFYHFSIPVMIAMGFAVCTLTWI